MRQPKAAAGLPWGWVSLLLVVLLMFAASKWSSLDLIMYSASLGQKLVTVERLEDVRLRSGPVEKQGLLDYRYVDIFGDTGPEPKDPDNWKEQQYQEHVRQISSRFTGGRVPNTHALRRFLLCPVWVNHKYKVAYIRIQKTGSTTITQRFTQCGKPGADPDTCLELLDASTNATLATTLWRSYFVFTTLRNPYSRFVSMYNFLTPGAAEHPAECDPLGYTWDAFCADPDSIGSHCPAHQDCCRGAVFGEVMYYRHIQQQSRCLATVDGTWAVDYLLRMEELTQDFQDMVAYVNALRAGWGADFPPLPDRLTASMPVANPSKHASFAEYLRAPHEGCLNRVRSFYADDLELLAPVGGAAAGGQQ